MWIPDAERLKMSAAEVEGGEGHLFCVKNALINHEKALYRERLTCYVAMRHPHGLRFRWSTVPQSPPRWLWWSLPVMIRCFQMKNNWIFLAS